MPSQMKPLHLAACFRNNEAVRRLLQLKAEVNARDERGDGALHWACVSDNGEGVRILLEARRLRHGKWTLEAISGLEPAMSSRCGSFHAGGSGCQPLRHCVPLGFHWMGFQTQGSTGSVNAAREMLTVPGVSLKDCFFWCMMFHGGRPSKSI